MPTINRTKTAIISANISQVARNKEIRQSFTERFEVGNKRYYLINEDEKIDADLFEKKFPITITHINADRRIDSRQC